MTDEDKEPKAESKTYSEKEVIGMIMAEKRRERRVAILLECFRLAKAAGMERGYLDEILNMISEVAGPAMFSEITGLQINPQPAPEPEKKSES